MVSVEEEEVRDLFHLEVHGGFPRRIHADHAEDDAFVLVVPAQLLELRLEPRAQVAPVGPEVDDDTGPFLF